MYRIRVFIGFVAILVTGYTRMASAQGTAERIDVLLAKAAENNLFNGSVLIADSGRVLIKKGYGEANMS